jgi:hypothetical protein
MSVAQQCNAQKPDGTPCRAAATASGRCFFHSGKAAEAGRKGGRRRKRPPIIPPLSAAEDVPLSTVADVVQALAGVFNAVRKGLCDPRTGNCLGLLGGQLLKALQAGELQAEMEALAKQIDDIKRAHGQERA